MKLDEGLCLDGEGEHSQVVIGQNGAGVRRVVVDGDDSRQQWGRVDSQGEKDGRGGVCVARRGRQVVGGRSSDEATACSGSDAVAGRARAAVVATREREVGVVGGAATKMVAGGPPVKRWRR